MNRIEQLLSLIQERPDDPFLHYALAKEYEKHGLVSKSLMTFQELHQNHPDYLPLYYQYAGLLINEGDLKKAVRCLHEGIALATDQLDEHTKSELMHLLQVASE